MVHIKRWWELNRRGMVSKWTKRVKRVRYKSEDQLIN